MKILETLADHLRKLGYDVCVISTAHSNPRTIYITVGGATAMGIWISDCNLCINSFYDKGFNKIASHIAEDKIELNDPQFIEKVEQCIKNAAERLRTKELKAWDNG